MPSSKWRTAVLTIAGTLEEATSGEVLIKNFASDAGRKAGEFYHIHSLGVDPQGNLITGESQGYRVQKFLFKGLSTAATR